MAGIWRTEYAAEEAMRSKEQFEKLAEVASRIVLLAQKQAGGQRLRPLWKESEKSLVRGQQFN
ncbi:MAG: hypothetical protein QW057_07870 [Candidatus Bathyarchaeia archaeon]